MKIWLIVSGILVVIISSVIVLIIKENSEYYITVEGILKYAPERDLSVSYPCPEGYYLECNVFGMVYLWHENIAKYSGRYISAKGTISQIRGRDRYPVFPLVKLISIEEIKQMN